MAIIVTILLVVLSVITFWSLDWIWRRSKRLRTTVRENHRLLSEAVKTATTMNYDVEQQMYYNIHGSYVPESGVSRQIMMTLIADGDREICEKALDELSSGKANEARISFQVRTAIKEPYKWITYRGLLKSERNAAGKVINIYHTLYDVTEEVELSEAMQGQSWIYQQCFEQSRAGLAYFDKNGKMQRVNPRARELFRKLFPSTLDDSVNIYDIEPFHSLRSPENLDPLHVCTRFQQIDGEGHLYLEIRSYPIYSENGELIFTGVTIIDVTTIRDIYLSVQQRRKETKEANDRANVYSMQFGHLLEFVDLQLWRPDKEREVFVISDDAKNYHDGKTFAQLRDTIYDDSVEQYETLVNMIKSGSEENIKFTLHEKPSSEDEGDHWYIVLGVPFADKEGKKEYFGIRRDITRLIRVEEQLREETERANNSTELKASFLANMTHEIRTPLNAIVGFSELLDNVEGDDKKEFIAIIKRNSDLLLRLLNDILLLSNIDSDQLESIPTPVDFAKTFSNIFVSISQRYAVPGVEFIQDNPFDSLVINIDRERVEQVINNFATNASKNTQKGHIKLGYSYDNATLRIYCEDTGGGIPKDKLQTIFERFYKVDNFVQGTGLGLSICKAIAKGCGGDIGVESKVGKGSTFWMTVPCERVEQ